MNELRPHRNESVSKDRMSKKDLKELKIIIYNNKKYRHMRTYVQKILSLPLTSRANQLILSIKLNFAKLNLN